MRELTIFCQRLIDVGAQPWLDSSELLHVAEFELVAIVPPGWVVPILLSPTTVKTRRLEMRVRIHGDPHVPPGGRNRERRDPAEDSRISDRAAARFHVRERAPLADTTNPVIEVVCEAQLGGNAANARTAAPCRRLPGRTG